MRLAFWMVPLTGYVFWPILNSSLNSHKSKAVRTALRKAGVKRTVEEVWKHLGKLFDTIYVPITSKMPAMHQPKKGML